MISIGTLRMKGELSLPYSHLSCCIIICLLCNIFIICVKNTLLCDKVHICFLLGIKKEAFPLCFSSMTQFQNLNKIILVLRYLHLSSTFFFKVDYSMYVRLSRLLKLPVEFSSLSLTAISYF